MLNTTTGRRDRQGYLAKRSGSSPAPRHAIIVGIRVAHRLVALGPVTLHDGGDAASDAVLRRAGR